MAHLYIPGVAEYAMCKRKFKLAEGLLEDPAEHKGELSDILQTLNSNPDAVRFLEEEFGQRYFEVCGQLSKACMPKFSLDETAADNGKKRTQNDWFSWWPSVTDGRVMASNGDLYFSFKLIKKMYEQGSIEERAKAQGYLDSLREDFDWPGKKNWLIGNTRHEYSGESFDCKIIHHFGSNLELRKEYNLVIPVYKRKPVLEVAREDEGAAYLQAYHDTEDDPETIIQTHEFISGKERKDIKVWTAGWSCDTEKASLQNRSEYPNRAAGFNYDNDVFHINGDDGINIPGCSRGVLFNPR